jgi:hypothetical protein
MLSTEEKRLRTKERHRRWYLGKKANDANFMAKMAKTSRLYYRKNDAYREVKKIAVESKDKNQLHHI